MLKGNKGEWSEVYVLLRLLVDGKIYAADSDLHKLEDIYFPIIEIIREESKGEIKEYFTGERIAIYVNGTKTKETPAAEFDEESAFLLEEIRRKSSKGAFSIERTQRFMDDILCCKLSAPAIDKSDITIKIVDVHTGYSPTVGFSIKSELGAAPTLLNAGKTTNFIYKIEHEHPEAIREANGIYRVSGGGKHPDVRGRISKIIKENGRLKYWRMNHRIFSDNLALIDSSMDKIIAETLLYFYRDGIGDCEEMVQRLERQNPMRYGNVNAYRYKFKKFLAAAALGMKPATVWDGMDEATGGYIIVTREGSVLAYHIYNRNYFEEYLLKNTRYETASTSRHDFGEIYSENGNDFINLNLQVRFKS
ncbi:HpaII family restriction endonuclease [uncultured Selenomonas sp.]|uniref:HpaII family restriction endonuclease n=1 Tax=uncultured Selenomonas sp. TaxID=159275 RepID=UPI0028DC6725|nr:HpaII family restriction endonuclease [uncultured Selenomonas sp.]